MIHNIHTRAKRKTMSSNLIPPSDKYEMSGLESLLGGSAFKPSSAEKGYHASEVSYDPVSYDAPAEDSRDPMSKFFGLTGTTSHDIQVSDIPITDIW
jgi:hypothetical protein